MPGRNTRRGSQERGSRLSRGQDTGLEERRLARAGDAENGQRPPVGIGTHRTELLDCLGNLARAAVEDGRVGIPVTEGDEAGKGRGARGRVDGKRRGVEPDLGLGPEGPQAARQQVGGVGVTREVDRAVGANRPTQVNPLRFRQHPAQAAGGLSAAGGVDVDEEQRQDALAHVPGGLELVEAVGGIEPVFGQHADHDPAGRGLIAQAVCPVVAAENVEMVDEGVAKAVLVQPPQKVAGQGVVLGCVAQEHSRHVARDPPLFQRQPQPRPGFKSYVGRAGFRRNEKKARLFGGPFCLGLG